MQMKQCEQGGHYYDATIHADCPYCVTPNVGATVAMDTGRTMPLANASSPDIGKTMPLTREDNAGKAAPPPDEGRTIAIVKESLGIDPVVGWLVNLEGNEKGRDYRIHTDNNFIGRSEKMDICIKGDDTISRENHATISFDSRDKVFYLSPGDGRSIVRLNDKALFQTAELSALDIIEIGKTRLVFAPLCGDKFEWA
jgi:hypothetical protein